MSQQEPWKSSNWFVSPYNFAEPVRAEFKFPTQVKFHDVTLRDGEQQTGVVFNKEDKIRIAEALAEAGVQRIEAGMPAVSPSDEAAIREIVKRNLGPQIFAFARCMVDDVKRAVDTGVKGVVMEVPSSEHMIKYCYQWSVEKAIESSVKATSYAHEQGLEVVFFPIDFTRAEINWVLDLILRVAHDGHMDALALVDTLGVLSPLAIQYYVHKVTERIPNTRLEAHFHMDFSMGVANTIMAVAEGVEVIHSTVLGLGERAGNTPMEETALALLTMHGVDTGLKFDKLYNLARLVEKLSGAAVPLNRPVVGEWLFQVESGIVVSFFQNCGLEHMTELFPYRPEFVGQPPATTVLGKGSGLDSVKIRFAKLGITATDEEVLSVLRAVKDFSLRHKRLLTEGEFRDVAVSVLPQKFAAKSGT
jgi:isopropylmalate/homocitrate/citramalate synthase